jgi:hypothetical protein
MEIPQTETTPEIGKPSDVREGGCSAWQLPPDETCARVARSLLRETLTALSLSADLIHDEATMVSELATNAYEHTMIGAVLRSDAGRYGVGLPELWLYRTADRLVCKVFDTLRHWNGQSRVEEELSEHGRGLGVVHALSYGDWGHHMTRSRLGTWPLPGKAVYFRMPITSAPPSVHLTSAEAAERLHLMLAARGIDRVYRTSAGNRSVLSVCHGLTVRCHDTHISWEGASGEVRRHTYELVDVAEEVLRRHEELRHPSGGLRR